jgi:hypothetical protein
MHSSLLPLDLPGAVALAAAVSAVATLIAARFAPNFVWYVAIGGPFFVAYSIYWGPTWLGADQSEYGSWQMFFLPPLYFAGAISSLVAVRLFRVLGRAFKELGPDEVSR